MRGLQDLLENRSLLFLGPANTTQTCGVDICAFDHVFITNNMAALMHPRPRCGDRAVSLILISNRFFGHRLSANASLWENMTAILCTARQTREELANETRAGPHVPPSFLMPALPLINYVPLRHRWLDRPFSLSTLLFMLQRVRFRRLHITGVTFYDAGPQYLPGYKLLDEGFRHSAVANKNFSLRWVAERKSTISIDYPDCARGGGGSSSTSFGSSGSGSSGGSSWYDESPAKRASRNVEASQGGETLYEPLPPEAAARLGNRLLGSGKCAFITGGNRDYLAALSCVARRLEAVGSRYPLLTMVQPEDEEFMRSHLHPHRAHQDSMILPWRPFPVGSRALGIRGARMNDKINVHAMPARRLVWIDADMFVRENIDKLCELPEDIELAAALNGAGGLPSYVWSSTTNSRFVPERRHCVARYNASLDAINYTFAYARDLQPPTAECPFMLNAGLLVIRPRNLSSFNEEFVKPMRNESIASYDGTDQGVVNTLLHGRRRLWANNWAVLHPRYNNVARLRLHAERHWRGIPTAVVHHTGLSGRPWLTNKSTLQYAEWHRSCS